MFAQLAWTGPKKVIHYVCGPMHISSPHVAQEDESESTQQLKLMIMFIFLSTQTMKGHV